MEINRVLLIDDEPDIRTVGELALTNVGGWQTILAASGAEGLELAANESPDVILLDVMMPEMDGLTVLERLKSKETTSGIPVVFMTAKVQRHEIDSYLEQGAAGVITKPFDPMELPNELTRIVAAIPAPTATESSSKLERIRQRYSAALGEKVETVAAAVERARQGDTLGFDEALQLAHRLAGTAGSYGHPQVSLQCGELERLLVQARAKPVTEALWQQVQEVLDKARAAARTGDGS